jgi:hypothetical protein
VVEVGSPPSAEAKLFHDEMTGQRLDIVRVADRQAARGVGKSVVFVPLPIHTAGYAASSSSGSPCHELVSTFISVWFGRSLSGSAVEAAVVQVKGKFSSIIAASDPEP